jgi:O-acetyl-ADP-ribose deacetylase (regulator of RNase III)
VALIGVVEIVAQISEITGNIFTSSCEVVTVTVNCVGIMGAGIAKECRIRYQDLFERYAELCEKRLLTPGKLLLWKSDQTHSILCFPTKNDWKHPSRMDFLVAGLDKLVATYQAKGIRSIAMPHLGCSHGGLKWADVHPVIMQKLAPLPDLTVELYAYDPTAPDDIMPALLKRFRSMSVTALAEQLEIGKAQATRLYDWVDSKPVESISYLLSTRGIGERTLEAVMNYHRTTSGGSSLVQEAFGFMD